jgi:hypothetical protein
MTTEQPPIDIATMPDEVAHLVEEVERTHQPRRFRRGNRTVAVLMPATPLDEGYQSIPALEPPRSWDEVTELAADEHAQHIAREGLHPPKRRRGRPTSVADPLWALVGMVTNYDGPTDVSENVDRYLTEPHGQLPA